jgi:hypothetical protein
MINSPLLDVTIGLVFIYLLYSLLATSIKETIATLFGLRAKMLKKGIVVGMLSNTTKDGVLKSIFKGIGKYFKIIYQKIFRKREKKESLGTSFYLHPIIKNYGANRLYPLPSYIPTSNFSTILIDVLKQDFDSKIDDIIKCNYSNLSDTEIAEKKQNLQNTSDALKIKELLDYYSQYYKDNPGKSAYIDKETLQILQLHLSNSIFNIDLFIIKIEQWFNDTMKRVTGWYKRQTQVIIFVIGILVAVIFNVDTIEITSRLSTDKDARDKLVQMATQAADRYKDDPRVKKTVTKEGVAISDTSVAGTANNDSIFKVYLAKVDSVKSLLNGDINKANSILAIGWGDFGKQRDSTKVLKELQKKSVVVCIDQKVYTLKNSKHRHKILNSLYNNNWIKYKVGYVLKETMRGRKFLGFLLTAFAISLGAPFWFDLLNKLVKLRSAGKKEDNEK